MNTRRGMGKGLGTGYKNIAPMDSHIHSLSAKGVKTYLIQPYNEGQELNYIETFNGTRQGAGKRQRQMRNALQKVLKDGTIRVSVSDTDGNELSFNAKGCVCEKFRKGGKDVACAICGKGMGVNEKPMSKSEFKKFMKSLNAKGSFSAGTVFEQLGGNKFRVMTGAKDFYRDDDNQEIGFKIGRNAKNVNYVKIRLNGKDLYDMEFLYGSVKGIKVKSKANDVYADQLQEVFTEHTGMATHL